MKCSICNGTLRYKNGLYVCESCSSTQQVSSTFQNEEVFIAYVENDAFGRRTKDSVIAQDIFNKLQAEGINTFYERVSAAELVGSDYNDAIEIATNSAKIIIVVGSSAENFRNLIGTYQKFLGDKTFIPVYSQMNAYKLPSEISNLQAVNYDAIGSVADIIKSILKKLDKAQNIDVITETRKEKSKRKRIMSYSLGVMGIVIVSVCIYIVFGTHYVLDSKKYEYAQKLEGNGNYIEALKMYFNFTDYKDTANRIDAIFDKYNGYFYGNNDELTLYLNIDKNANSKIEITRQYNGEHISIQTEAKVQESIISFEYKDSLNNRGIGKIELLNTGLKLTVITDEKDSLSINNIEQEFKLTDRNDAPQIKSISQKDLINWMNNHLTLQDIHKMGFQTEFIVDLYPVGNSQNVYKITNTDYGIMISDNETNAESVVGIYVPFEDVFPDTDFSYVPFTLEDNAFIPYKVYIGGATNLMYELGGIETDFLETTYFITSKDATVGIWDEIVKSITEFYEYNKTDGIKYHLEKTPDDGTDTRIEEYENLYDAINDAKAKGKENYIVVSSDGKVIYIP